MVLAALLGIGRLVGLVNLSIVSWILSALELEALAVKLLGDVGELLLFKTGRFVQLVSLVNTLEWLESWHV